MSEATVIYWFRQDLRLSDLPGLHAAARDGYRVLPVYILDDAAAGEWQPGGASRWWLHQSLAALGAAIAELGGELILRRGDSGTELSELAAASGAESVLCSRAYEPWAAALEHRVHEALADQQVTLKRFPGTLLFEPESIANQSGLPFKVFTPFWKHCLRQEPPQAAPADPSSLQWFTAAAVDGLALEALALEPRQPNWAAHWPELWTPGEAGASATLDRFLEQRLAGYAEGRDHPALETTSRLSPHLRFGEISPRQVWQRTRARAGDGAGPAAKFLSELGWREFSYHLLHHFPAIPTEPFKPQFSAFPWLGNPEHLTAWQRGQSGYPIVDAGMRELWHTGFMHNRVRMIVASFLTKHLLLPWRTGEDWFWDTLVDADLASNSCSWQWVAGSGADAAPYFRIFNPTLQGQKFDKAGDYVRRWVPEIAALPNKHLHEPAAAPAAVLAEAGITLGDTYPAPIVEHKLAREAALAAYGAIKAA